MPPILCNACMLLVPLSLVGGAIVGLPALLPPFRGWAQHRRGLRRVLIVLAALVAFVVSYALWARTYAEMNYGLALDVYNQTDCYRERCLRDIRAIYDSRVAVAQELWLRYLVPPPLRSACYSADADVCERADETYWGVYHQHVPEYRPWAESLAQAALAIPPAVAAGVVVWRVTRPRPATETLPNLPE